MPDNVSVIVDQSANLLNAVKAAGLYVLSSCGGKGNCGKCKLIVKTGNVESGNSDSFFVCGRGGARLRACVPCKRQEQPYYRNSSRVAHAG